MKQFPLIGETISHIYETDFESPLTHLAPTPDSGSTVPGHGCCRRWRQVAAWVVAASLPAQPLLDGKCSIAMADAWSGSGKSRVAASGQLVSARVDGGRAQLLEQRCSIAFSDPSYSRTGQDGRRTYRGHSQNCCGYPRTPWAAIAGGKGIGDFAQSRSLTPIAPLLKHALL